MKRKKQKHLYRVIKKETGFYGDIETNRKENVKKYIEEKGLQQLNVMKQKRFIKE